MHFPAKKWRFLAADGDPTDLTLRAAPAARQLECLEQWAAHGRIISDFGSCRRLLPHDP
jgi:hypothetical protein